MNIFYLVLKSFFYGAIGFQIIGFLFLILAGLASLIQPIFSMLNAGHYFWVKYSKSE